MKLSTSNTNANIAIYAGNNKIKTATIAVNSNTVIIGANNIISDAIIDIGSSIFDASIPSVTTPALTIGGITIGGIASGIVNSQFFIANGTWTKPAGLTAATGMDALTHNMEAFLAKNYHPICDGIALEGMRLIAKSIVKAVKNPDIESRSDMLLASMMGAIAFQKGLGVVHSLAHPLSSLLDTHHGLANAVNLPYGMEYNIK